MPREGKTKNKERTSFDDVPPDGVDLLRKHGSVGREAKHGQQLLVKLLLHRDVVQLMMCLNS